MHADATRLPRLTLLAVAALAGCSGGSSGIEGAAVGIEQAGNTPASPTPGAPPPAAGASFVNPLLASGPDPYVIQANGIYYYTHTSGDRIELWVTTAMSRLDRASHGTIFVPPAAGPNAHDLWAPELHRLDGRWYLYYAAGDGSSTATDPHASQRIHVLENDSADPTQGAWIDRGRLASPDPDAWAIDGTVMEHGGERYFIWSGRASADDGDQHLYIEKMLNPWTLGGGRVLISSPDRAWERAGGVGVNEAPQVLENRQGRVFLIYSANGCWTDDYSLGMLTLRANGDPLEPADWTKSARPVFATSAANGVYGPGHNSFFRSPDGTQDWVIYHANASRGRGCGDARSPRMQPIAWREDGTPDFGTPAAIGASMPAPAGEGD